MEEETMVMNWDDLLDVADMDNLLVFDDPIPVEGQSPLDEIEHHLFNDDHDDDDVNVVIDDFFNDIFVNESPPIPVEEVCVPNSGSSSDLSDEDDLRNQNQNQNQKKNQKKKKKNEASAPDDVVAIDDRQQKEDEEGDNSHEDDPLTKKRKRQLRNKDAALRSRERKKSYVKDLEMKSRYYEAECRRLGTMLQCFMAENQALRFSLHSSKLTFDTTSITKQESAVLFLESLLLGSLLWLMAVVCQLLVLPSQLVEVTVVEEKLLPSPVLRKGPSKASIQILMVGKRFKASRSRMRPALDSPLQVVNNVLLAVF